MRCSKSDRRSRPPTRRCRLRASPTRRWLRVERLFATIQTRNLTASSRHGMSIFLRRESGKTLARLLDFWGFDLRPLGPSGREVDLPTSSVVRIEERSRFRGGSLCRRGRCLRGCICITPVPDRRPSAGSRDLCLWTGRPAVSWPARCPQNVTKRPTSVIAPSHCLRSSEPVFVDFHQGSIVPSLFRFNV